MDVCVTKNKLEKGLKALDFLDTNMNIISNWLTDMEYKLNEIEDIPLTEDNLEVQIKLIKVRFIMIIKQLLLKIYY